MTTAIPNNLPLLRSACTGADPEFGKRGGTLLKKVEEQKKKKKKVATIIDSYPLPNILYHVCYVK